ncbi:MAG: GspE/PulE family protein [bacterium]|nr:GspE/PulE family protein [bacterium]
MHVDERALESFMIDSGLVSQSEIGFARNEAREKNSSTSKVLLAKGILGEDDLRRLEAYALGIPFVDLKDWRPDFKVLSLVPEPISRHHNIVAFNKTSDGLEVVMLSLEALAAIEFVKKKMGLKILPRLTDAESMKSALLSYQKILKAEFGDIIQEESLLMKQNDLKNLSESQAAARIVDTLLKHAVIQGASDIHIEPEADRVLVRYRINGTLHEAMVLPKHTAPGIATRIKVLSDLNLSERRMPQDGRFKVEADGEKISFRVSTLPVANGEKMVLSVFREGISGFNFETLGFQGRSLDLAHEALQERGLIVVSGPKGSGRTTTLYTMLDILNAPNASISTIEDPIEYHMARVNQTEVRPEIGLTFASGFRALLRQDPDVVMVGEIRDPETAGLTVNSALTGRLTLSALDANFASDAIQRLIDMKVEPFLLASTLNIVICQRLVKKSSGLNTTDPDAGKVGIFEVLKVTPTIRHLIMACATAGEIEEQAKSEGMMTLVEDGAFKADQSIVSMEEVMRAISE